MMRRSTIAGVLAALVALPLASASGRGSAAVHVDGTATVVPVVAAQRPNMVLILMDDFSTELLRTMPQALRMKQEGAFYRNAFVVDSLCCPSRSALLTGQTPHQTGVLTNTPRDRDHPIGGYNAFVANGNAKRTSNLALQQSGYTTGFVGKFLNMYDAHVVDGRLRPPPKVPGWTVWNAILGGGYSEWGFRSTWLDATGAVRLQDHAKPPEGATDARKDEKYATRVAGDKAVAFLDAHREDAKPFFLEIATYGPHASIRPAYRGDPAFPPAFRDRPTAGGRRPGQLRRGGLLAADPPRPQGVRRPARRQPPHLSPAGRRHTDRPGVAHQPDHDDRRPGRREVPQPGADGAVHRPVDRPGAPARRT